MSTMKIFVWEHAECLTDNYHDGGGVLAVAASEDAARAAIADEVIPAGPPELEGEPKVWPTSDDAEPTAIIFPDAGCC